MVRDIMLSVPGAGEKLSFCLGATVLVPEQAFCGNSSISASEPELDLPVPGDRLGSVTGVMLEKLSRASSDTCL